jgi:hypothetical protein
MKQLENINRFSKAAIIAVSIGMAIHAIDTSDYLLLVNELVLIGLCVEYLMIVKK